MTFSPFFRIFLISSLVCLSASVTFADERTDKENIYLESNTKLPLEKLLYVLVNGSTVESKWVKFDSGNEINLRYENIIARMPDGAGGSRYGGFIPIEMELAVNTRGEFTPKTLRLALARVFDGEQAGFTADFLEFSHIEDHSLLEINSIGVALTQKFEFSAASWRVIMRGKIRGGGAFLNQKNTVNAVTSNGMTQVHGLLQTEGGLGIGYKKLTLIARMNADFMGVATYHTRNESTGIRETETHGLYGEKYSEGFEVRYEFSPLDLDITPRLKAGIDWQQEDLQGDRGRLRKHTLQFKAGVEFDFGMSFSTLVTK